MLLRAAMDGSVSAPTTVLIPRYVIGGILISADSTNAATVIIRQDSSNGKAVFKLVTKVPIMIVGPISLEGTQTAYLDVSGTGAAAQLYEWLE